MNEATPEEDDWLLVLIALVGIAGGTYYHGLEFAVTTIGVLIGLLLIGGVSYYYHNHWNES